MKLNKKSVFFGLIILIVLLASFFMDVNIEKSTENDLTSVIKQESSEDIIKNEQNSDKKKEEPSEQIVTQVPDNIENKEREESKALDFEISIENTDKKIPNEETMSLNSFTCTLSVTCHAILQNIELLKDEKKDIVPKDGIIFKEKQVEFSDGESVFDVLFREIKNNKIHFEFVKTPGYNSAYIEGIANLYEFDCGEYSGWMYRVNGIKPTYGCSQYIIENGDKIEFYYSCNFLEDK